MDENITLLIAGQIRKKYRKLAEGLQIEFVGFQSNMANIFRDVDFFILPSLYDPCPLVVLEAMACGVPVIVSGQTGISELIKDKQDGLILKNPTDIKELREKILLLTRNKDLRDKIAKQGIKSAKRIVEIHNDFWGA